MSSELITEEVKGEQKSSIDVNDFVTLKKSDVKDKKKKDKIKQIVLYSIQESLKT